MPSVRAKLLAVPSGSTANTVSVPRKSSMFDDNDPSPPPMMTIGAFAIACLDRGPIRFGVLDRLGVDQLDPAPQRACRAPP